MQTLTRYAAPFEVVARDLEDGVLLLDFRSGECFQLDPIGALAWRLIEEGIASSHDIIFEFCDRFNAPRERVEEDMEQFFEALVSQRLLVLCP